MHDFNKEGAEVLKNFAYNAISGGKILGKFRKSESKIIVGYLPVPFIHFVD
jgi:hypothetical protein